MKRLLREYVTLLQEASVPWDVQEKLFKKHPMLKQHLYIMDSFPGDVQKIRVSWFKRSQDFKKFYDIIASEPDLKLMWDAGPIGKTDFTLHSRAMPETHDEKRNSKKKSSTSKKIDMSNYDVDPTTEFSKKQLYDAAKATGHALFDDHRSGLVWGSKSVKDVKFVMTNTLNMLKQEVDGRDDEMLDVSSFGPSTFEFVFFPSRPGEGVDASDDLNYVVDREQLSDDDELIYVCDNTDQTTIYVIMPTIKYEETYASIVEDLLDA